MVIVWKLDRLARSTRDLLEISDTIAQAGAGLKSLSEPWADTTSPAGRMVLTVFAGLAEFERELIKERTGTGRITAARGLSTIRRMAARCFPGAKGDHRPFNPNVVLES
jgi:DNA invertase Pin-like site-specific DNA recombinase